MRYILEKKSGSLWALVVDTQTGLTVRRFHILKGVGLNNGWCRAERKVNELNMEDKAKNK